MTDRTITTGRRLGYTTPARHEADYYRQIRPARADLPMTERSQNPGRFSALIQK